jgi:diguanylate cyclase (GGDEF)-like protein/PAS domain S-box-containing protein
MGALDMLRDTSNVLGLALVCDFNGKVREIIWDDFDIKEKLLEYAHFTCIFDTESIKKGLAFFLQVKERGAVFDWEINVATNALPIAFYFSAVSIGDRLVIFGTVAGQSDNKIYDGLSLVINQQVNNIRLLQKKTSLENPEGNQHTSLNAQVKVEMLTDMLALNNRLVNAERQLARKNAELKRMSSLLSKDLHLAQRILDFSGEAVMVANNELQVINVNSAYTAITGFSKQEATSGKLLQLNEPVYASTETTDAILHSVSNQGLWQGECMGRRKNGELFPKWLSVSLIPGTNGETDHYVVNFSDISRLKFAEEQLQYMAFYDLLTNLPNRTLFKDRLQQAMTQASRESTSLVLLFIDLDDFKLINDSLGHDAGDKLLNETARRLESCTREVDSIYRLGGDEFTIIMQGCHNEIDAMQVSDKIINILNTPFLIQDNSVRIGASIGIARYPMDGDNPETLTKNADTAMYAAKTAGRNTRCFFSKSLGEKVSNYLNLKNQIAEGLLRGEFLVYIQPEIDFSTDKVISMEALVRWQHPTRGLMEPDEFIPAAENSGLIIDLGELVLCEALRMVQLLRILGWKDMRVGVNVSARQLHVPNFAEMIVNKLHEYHLPGNALMVEITESMVLGNLENVVKILQSLKTYGVEAAIDDFGTGYSSLNHLRRLPVEYIKIDKSFIADVDVSLESETIVRAIMAMAKTLGLKTIAEGIERPTQLALMQQHGCEIGQGYLYSKALPYKEFLDYISAKPIKFEL